MLAVTSSFIVFLFFLMMTANIVAWNVQGVRSPEFLQALRELTNLHDPKILTLFETKISGQ